MSANLIDRVSSPERVAEDPFQLLKDISIEVNRAAVRGFEDPVVQRIVLYALENRRHFGKLQPMLESLLRARGLYPYMDPKSISGVEQFALSAHRPIGMEDVVFHQEQSEIYLRLLSGENVILSAPTSFGKSLIVDALIASGKYNNVAVVVPTIALIDETRRRFGERFATSFKVLTHSSQSLSDRNILVMTQERILDFAKIPPIDLFVIDEFYKLDPRRDSDRSLLLNQALYKLLKTGAQFFMIGPSIERIPQICADSWRSTFVATPYATVVTEHVNVESSKSGALERLVELCATLDDSTLIYCASPASARRVATALIGASGRKKSEELSLASEWVGDSFHPDWIFARAISHGIGVHHGKVPRALGQYAVRAFNDGHLKFLVCTSTLIEGVNTKAKNVIIYDNRVATKKFDYFTFNNIRGRSGRMFQHFIGRVFLFNAPPQEDLPFVDFPLVTQGEGTPESLLIQFDDGDLTDASRQRVSHLHEQSELSVETIKKNSGIDPELQIRMAAELRSNPGYQRVLSWTGHPSYEQLEFVCRLMWEHFVQGARFGGVYSSRQLAFRLDSLRKARSLRRLILAELASQDSPDADAAVEDVLDFVRTWATFHFPRFLMAIDRIQREVYSEIGGQVGDYSAYAAGVENIFTSTGLVALDEYGIPIQIAEKIAAYLGDHSSVDGAIAGLKTLSELGMRGLTSFERKLVLDARKSVGGI